MIAVTVTPFGWAVLPFALVFVAAVVAVVVILVRRRREEIIGFDRDEAISYVWGNLARSVKRRVSLGDVATVIDAQRALAVEDQPADDAELVAVLCLEIAASEGIDLAPDDVACILVQQYRYAEEKGLFES